MEHRRKDSQTGLFLAAAAALSWALSPLFIYYIARGDVDMHTQNALRYFAGGLALLAGAWFSVKEDLRACLKAWPRLLLILGLLVSYQTALVAGINLILPAAAALISRSTVLWTILISLLFFPEERPRLRRPAFVMGTLLSFLGVVGVIAFRGGAAGLQGGRGVVYCLLAAFLWSCYTAYGQKAFKAHNPLAFTPLVFIASGLVFTTFAVLWGEPACLLRADPGVMAALVVSGVVCIGIAQVFYYHAMRLCGMAVSANVTLAVPFLTALGSYYLYGDRMTALQLLSGLVLAAGIYLSSLEKSIKGGWNGFLGPRPPPHRRDARTTSLIARLTAVRMASSRSRG